MEEAAASLANGGGGLGSSAAVLDKVRASRRKEEGMSGVERGRVKKDASRRDSSAPSGPPPSTSSSGLRSVSKRMQRSLSGTNQKSSYVQRTALSDGEQQSATTSHITRRGTEHDTSAYALVLPSRSTAHEPPSSLPSTSGSPIRLPASVAPAPALPPRPHASFLDRRGEAAEAIVLEVGQESRAFTDGLVAFLAAYNAGQPNAAARVAYYTGRCRIVRHGAGLMHYRDGRELKGQWDYNEFKGQERQRQRVDQAGMEKLLDEWDLPDEASLSTHPSPQSPPVERWHAQAALSSALPAESVSVGEGGQDGLLGSPPMVSPRSPKAAPAGPPVRGSEGSVRLVLNRRTNSGAFPNVMSEDGRPFQEFFPDELMVYILSFLDIRSLLNASMVSTEWRRLTNDALLWTGIHERFWGLPDESDGGRVVDWKDAVRSRFLLERNWTHGRYHMSTLRAHSGWVTGVDFVSNKLVSCSYDGTLRVWNTQTGNTLQTLRCETPAGGLTPLWCCRVHGNRAVAGASDSNAREFDILTGKLVHMYEGHTGGVKCLQLDERMLLTGSDDKTIRMYDLRVGRCVKAIDITGSVSCLHSEGHILCCASKRENCVYKIDLRELKRRSVAEPIVLEGHSKAVYCMQMDLAANRLITGSRDRQILMWDLARGNVTRRFVGHRYSVMTLHFDKHRLVSGGADESIRLWDVNSGECLQILTGHTGMVNSVRLDLSKIASGSTDRTCVVYDFVRSSEPNRRFNFFDYA